jgi:hypothetical protein
MTDNHELQLRATCERSTLADPNARQARLRAWLVRCAAEFSRTRSSRRRERRRARTRPRRAAA